MSVAAFAHTSFAKPFGAAGPLSTRDAAAYGTRSLEGQELRLQRRAGPFRPPRSEGRAALCKRGTLDRRGCFGFGRKKPPDAQAPPAKAPKGGKFGARRSSSQSLDAQIDELLRQGNHQSARWQRQAQQAEKELRRDGRANRQKIEAVHAALAGHGGRGSTVRPPSRTSTVDTREVDEYMKGLHV